MPPRCWMKHKFAPCNLTTSCQFSSTNEKRKLCFPTGKSYKCTLISRDLSFQSSRNLWKRCEGRPPAWLLSFYWPFPILHWGNWRMSDLRASSGNEVGWDKVGKSPDNAPQSWSHLWGASYLYLPTVYLFRGSRSWTWAQERPHQSSQTPRAIFHIQRKPVCVATPGRPT